ncbi:MAG TPA: 50S ribosomal protein L35 [Candidatus Aminicenantes bacterium]|nr:50S ribosomal protein L35 [Candidatus Aminicenantes bacterium]HRY64119.1 50S ribosomal protein L35 [Candidatus Aminicenantes bacterium]HRZ71032.1 50S ribosomal protein L35 [Candidatus Aminicenantes bacterium]
MPKLKTHKGAQKRFKVTAKKKLLHAQANRKHILTKKASKRKRHLGKASEASAADRKALKTMLPYDL